MKDISNTLKKSITTYNRREHDRPQEQYEMCIHYQECMP